MLSNGGFEGGTWRKTWTGEEFGEISVPLSWIAFWYAGLGRPEMKVIRAEEPYLSPPRVALGDQAVQWFTFYRAHDAGLYQQVAVPAGATLKLSALAHSWYSQGDDPHVSQYEDDDGELHEIHDGEPGMLLLLGLDADGDTDPFAEKVDWQGAYFYDGHREIALTVPGCSGTVTVFLRSLAEHSFKHCDAYWDDVRLEVVEGPQHPVSNPVDYVVTVHLAPQGCTDAESDHVQAQARPQRQSLVYSHDDARRLVAPGLPGSKAIVWAPERWNFDVVAHLRDAGCGIEIRQFPTVEPPVTPVEPPVTPPPVTPVEPPSGGWEPESYVPTGTKLGFHGVGDGGQSGDIFAPLLVDDACPPTAKIVASLGAAGDILRTGAWPQIVGRIIDYPNLGNLEGFNYTADPIWQAEDRMAKLMPLWAPYRGEYDYWEIVNEQAPPSAQAHAQLARFFVRAMQIAQANGYRLAIFSHSTGTPEPAAWDAIVGTGVFETAAMGDHAISLHEYGNVDADFGSHLCRYRDLYERIILPRQLNIPLYITEYNLWREVLQTWDVNNPEHRERLMRQWITYDRWTAYDEYVAGVHIYSVGELSDLYRQWIYALYPRFRQYAVSEKDRENA